MNSRGSSPAVGRFAPSGLLSCFPRIIEVIRTGPINFDTLQTSKKPRVSPGFFENSIVTSQKRGALCALRSAFTLPPTY
ncbi:hypothetical protein AUK22_02370 [bacterium CG2_30_54_10]|nr:MAG: hypothetical protein AUK22_02370 [bacterium CG2_30_54_10]